MIFALLAVEPELIQLIFNIDQSPGQRLTILFRALFLFEISTRLSQSGGQRLVFAIARGELFCRLVQLRFGGIQLRGARISLLLGQALLGRKAILGLFQLLLQVIQLCVPPGRRLNAIRSSPRCSWVSLARLRKPNTAAPSAQRIETTNKNLIISRLTFCVLHELARKLLSQTGYKGKPKTRKRTTPNSKLSATYSSQKKAIALLA